MAVNTHVGFYVVVHSYIRTTVTVFLLTVLCLEIKLRLRGNIRVHDLGNSPVVLLLDGGSQLLVEALQVCEAHQQGVPLGPDQFLGLTDILHLPIPGLKPAQKNTQMRNIEI